MTRTRPEGVLDFSPGLRRVMHREYRITRIEGGLVPPALLRTLVIPELGDFDVAAVRVIMANRHTTQSESAESCETENNADETYEGMVERCDSHTHRESDDKLNGHAPVPVCHEGLGINSSLATLAQVPSGRSMCVGGGANLELQAGRRATLVRGETRNAMSVMLRVQGCGGRELYRIPPSRQRMIYISLIINNNYKN